MSVDTVLLGGRYRLDGLIGRGGMASVWRAEDTELGRTVAVKRLHARLATEPELAERFRREGQAVARLNHPNLVRLLDQGQEGDEPFLVFELIDGRDLKTIIRSGGRLDPASAASVCAQVARALASAHDAGVVHRDIKSHNVIVTDDGIAKLTDFGIARILEAEAAGLTRTGIVMGSSDYLAPEQAEGKDVDERGDIYSLGVVLFEALTGRLPFTGDNPVAVATKHVYEDPPDPRKLASDVPRPLAATCLRALAKRPAQRFPDAAAFAEALERHEGATAIQPVARVPGDDGHTTGRMRAVRTRRRRGRRAWVPVVAVLGVGAAALAAWQTGVIGDGGDGGAPAAVPLTVSDYDPLGDDGVENPDLVAYAADGDPATVWQTVSYGTANLGQFKAGVGLRLSLDAPAGVSAVRITSPTPGGSVQILGPGDDDPTSRPVLGSGALADGPVDIPVTLDGSTGELIVWITELPRSGEGDLPFRAAIGEVAVLGVANS